MTWDPYISLHLTRIVFEHKGAKTQRNGSHLQVGLSLGSHTKLNQKVRAQLLVFTLPETNSTYYGEKKARRKVEMETLLILILLGNVI